MARNVRVFEPMGENKNFVIFAVLSLAILMGYQMLYLGPKYEEQQRLDALAAQQAETVNPSLTPEQISALAEANSPTIDASGTTTTDTSSVSYQSAGFVSLGNDEIEGAIALKGARFDNLSLLKHKTNLEGDELVQLLRGPNDPNSYQVRFGWSVGGKPAEFVPGPNTVWTADSQSLSPNNPVILSWDNGEGVTFKMLVEMDERFMFTVRQTLDNNSGEALIVAPYGRIQRRGTPDTDGLYILHEGAIGVINGELQEVTYEDLEEDGAVESPSTGGWMGITDKFWMTALIPDQQMPLKTASVNYRFNGAKTYRAEYLQEAQVVANGTMSETTNRLYAGAKIVGAIDDYADQFGVALFDRAIDWGWFWFLTKPIFAAVHFFFELTGNFGVAILLMTVVLKLILFPLANKSYVSMSHMKTAQPKIKALQERYGDDRAKMQQEMMALYKKEGINPMAGCLPLIPQMFIFFALYKVLYVTIEMRHQPFFGWIQDLSAADPLTPVNLFGLIPWDPPSIIAVGILPILMGLSMWLQQKLNPQTSMDPTQQKVMAMLPLIFTFVMAQFSAGLVLYWTWNNILSIAQQWVIMNREEKRQTAAKAARN